MVEALPPTIARESIRPWDLPPPDPGESPEYWAAVRRIYAYSEAHRTPAEVALAQTRKIDRMRVLLQLLGTPQAAFSTILVAGTKGKGSMTAVLTSILAAGGYRVGRYTQPHLYSYRERIWAAGDYVTEAELVDELEAMEDALAIVERQRSELGPLTTFDVGTALTVLHFARARVQLGVVEVGVGGANDATNALEPISSLVGPVGLDHVQLLGNSLTEVATQKIGVARRGIDVVIGAQETEARAALQVGAAAVGARLHELGKDFGWSADDPCSGPFEFRGQGCWSELDTPLVGRFQRDNISVAMAAAERLRAQGWPLSDEAIRAGVAQVHWPGRFQSVVLDPLTIVDGAHNQTSARALAETIREYLGDRPVTLVLGMTDTKDIPAILSELAPVAREAIITRSSHPQGRAPEEVLVAARNAGLSCRVVPSPSEAVLAAWAEQRNDGVTIVTGSLFLAGDVLAWLRQMAPEAVTRNG